MSDDPEKPTYKVGYKKPPIATRFKPGQSGNQRGRPKRSKNVSTIVEKEARSLVSIVEQGQKRTLSKIEIAIKHLANKAASGDSKALLILIGLLPQSDQIVTDHHGESTKPPAPLTLEEAEEIYREALKNAKPAE